MTPQQAAQIIEHLALGVDPRTGEVLGEGDICTAPEIIRALFLARNALLPPPAVSAARPRKTPFVRNGVELPNVGKKWSGDDVDTLLRQFEAGTPLGQIAVQLGRTDGSIVARLVHAGVLPDRETGYTLLKAHREEGGGEHPPPPD
ncbi:hypothetical protein ACFFTM_03395 [Pseudoduganella plicata]|uniref:Uncharacterized protein n=1 Tax=Pseudoduganella plicata TaxID=321984 RepID=A0A4P7BG60_9BURK|nr:hypothetical protein [Pseudoduganella plicata]QBQ36997.1 hypothetical protein E1742_13085 [Pseudoduganella plicata]GGZ08258.1 hypothetical protein GCM10007388_47280 [Pseudoduganella plicata]